MKTVIIVLIISLLLFLLVKKAYKLRDQSDSKLNVNQHPGTFKKPDIEMVNAISQKQKDLSKTINIPSIEVKDKPVTD